MLQYKRPYGPFALIVLIWFDKTWGFNCLSAFWSINVYMHRSKLIMASSVDCVHMCISFRAGLCHIVELLKFLWGDLWFQVKLNPRPWGDRWERKNLKGIEPLDLPQRFWDRAAHPQIAEPWLKHDLMQQYRYCITFVYLMPMIKRSNYANFVGVAWHDFIYLFSMK